MNKPEGQPPSLPRGARGRVTEVRGPQVATGVVGFWDTLASLCPGGMAMGCLVPQAPSVPLSAALTPHLLLLLHSS